MNLLVCAVEDVAQSKGVVVTVDTLPRIEEMMALNERSMVGIFFVTKVLHVHTIAGRVKLQNAFCSPRPVDAVVYVRLASKLPEGWA